MAGQGKKPDYNTPTKKKKLIELLWRNMMKATAYVDTEHEIYLRGAIGARRKQAILNYMDRAEKDFASFGLSSVAEQFVKNELVPAYNYNHLNDDNGLRIGAALWILDKLRMSGKLTEAYAILPDVSRDADAWYLPMDFAHPCYANDLIHSVIYVISRRYSKEPVRDVVITEQNTTGKKPNELYQQLLSFLPEEDIASACAAFKTKLWEILTRYLRGQAYFDKEFARLDAEIEKAQNQSLIENKPIALLRSGSPVMREGLGSAIDFSRLEDVENKILDLEIRRKHVDDRMIDFFVCFDSYLQMDKRTLRQKAGREIAEALDGFYIDDPYALCFALFYLMDNGDDAPWLMRSGSFLMVYVLRMLPWQDAEKEWLIDEDEEWYEGLRYDRNGWLEQEPIEEKIDYYHEKHGSKNLAQVIYELCRTVVPTGLHPFEADRKRLISEGMDETTAEKVTDTAELLFLYEFQARQISRDEWDLFPELEEEASSEQEETDSSVPETMPKLGGYWGKVMGLNPSDEEIPDADDDAQSFRESSEADKAEIEGLKAELRAVKKQLKGLHDALADARHETNSERAKYEHEQKIFRREHRELADLRELVFNAELTEDEQVRRERVEKQYSYPYETKKRTIIFGGHDTWLKAIRPMLPDVKFVDTEQRAFNPELVRNAEVVWVQNNCISHSQFGNIVKLTRQYGIQMRYFAYASAEKCAEQLVEWDLKKG